MLLQIGLVIAIISTITEIMVVHGSKIIAHLYTHGLGPIKGIWFNTAGSFALSYLIGMLCQAEGVTVMLGFALSTGMSQLYFALEKWVQDNKGFATIFEYGKDRYHALRQATKGLGELLTNLWKVIVITLKIITAPIRAAQWTKTKYNNIKVHLHHN